MQSGRGRVHKHTASSEGTLPGGLAAVPLGPPWRYIAGQGWPSDLQACRVVTSASYVGSGLSLCEHTRPSGDQVRFARLDVEARFWYLCIQDPPVVLNIAF
jgi:hypothetical protein